MLEKIINITPGSDYKNSTRPARQGIAARYLNELHSSTYDSVTISPASAFISAINWQLRKLKRDQNKVEIIFEFDGLEFITNVSTSDLLKNTHLNYHVKKEANDLIYRVEINFSVTSKVSSEISSNVEVRSRLDALNKFVRELLEMPGDKYLLKASDYNVTKLFYSDLQSIKDEFDYINNCIINFIEKLLNIKVHFDNTAAQDSFVELKSILLKKL